MNQQTKTRQKHKQLWTVQYSWSTEYDGNVYETKDLIVFNKSQVLKYIKDNYDISKSDDMSDSETFLFSYNAIYDELGNESSKGWDSVNCEVKEGFYEQTDNIEAYKSYEIITESQIQELKDKFSYHVVVDLTEE